jgi:hypothetical protein
MLSYQPSKLYAFIAGGVIEVGKLFELIVVRETGLVTAGRLGRFGLRGLIGGNSGLRFVKMSWGII